MPWSYVIGDIKGKEIVEAFHEKELQKTNQWEFRAEKVIKRKGDKLYVKYKGYDSYFNSCIDKKRHSINSEYFLEPKSLGGRVKIELDLPNYATKADLKIATGVDTSKCAKKVDLTNLNFNVDKLDIDKLKTNLSDLNLSNLKSKVDKLDFCKLVPVPVDLSKLSDAVKNDVVKKDV